MTTFIYVSNTFNVEIVCYDPEDDSCKNIAVNFW